MSEQKHALRDAVVACLTAILSGQHDDRRSAEEELRTLEVTEEFGVVLAEITVSSESPLPYRQLSSIVLKQYVELHWSRLGEKFCEPMPSEQTKAAIRKLLPAGLNDPQSKVRGTVAYAIAAIAHWDWPENWPDLFGQLMLALGSGEPQLVHGAMRVLSEFCHDVSDQQMPQVAPVILPQLVKVIVHSEVYGARTRARAVHIFHTCATLIYAMSHTFPDVSKSLLLPVLPQYLSAFVAVLGSGREEDVDPGLRKEVIMTLCSLLRAFPRALQADLITMVTPVWNILLKETPLYVARVVNSLEGAGGLCDSDGETISHESTLFAVFEFIAVLGENRRLQRLLPPILPQLCYLLISHMQVTEEQAGSWLADVEQFIDEDENDFSYSIRLSALDLITGLCEEASLAGSVCTALVAAVDRHLHDSPANSSQHWWKVHEACLLALGRVVEEAVKSSQSGAQFDCQAFTKSVLLPDLALPGCPLLTGRGLWLASKMAPLLNPETLTPLLEMVARGLQSSQPAVVRVLAVKAVYQFCSELRHTEHAHLLQPCLPHYLDYLIDMSGDSPDYLLPLSLEALQLVAQISPELSAQYGARIVGVAIDVFLKYSHDPGVSTFVEELFGTLAANAHCRGNLQSRFLPTALEILQSDDSQLPLGLVAAVLDVLVQVVRGCGCEGVPPMMVMQIFPCMVRRVMSSDDSALLQNGGECVRAYISVAFEQLASWRDEGGRSGLDYVVQVVLYLLEPARPEFSAAFVGKLIIAFVKKASGALGDHLELLLRAVLSKMQVVETSSVMQSLIIVFAFLVHTQLEAVVVFLSQVPDPTGQPALDFVLTQWCYRHSFFYGVYETRLSTVALSKLLAHCVATGDERLIKIIVKGEELHSANEGIVTRSQRPSPQQAWSEVPLPVKLVKLLLSDVTAALEAPEEEEEDEEEEEGEDVDSYDAALTGGGVEGLEALLAPASAYPGYDGGGRISDWEVEEDPDLQDEPVLQLDIQAHLVQCLSELSRQPCFSSIKPLLTLQEVATLRTIGVLC